MKKITICLFILFAYQFGFSQLFVKTGSSVYVKNTVLFAKGNVELDGTSTLYLRNEAQLAQGTTGTSANKGTGKISIFQEGTSDNYEYNYWCSPVGNASITAGNENFDISMLNRPTTNTSSTPAITTGSYNGVSVPLTIAKYWIWTFRSNSNYTDWFQISDMPYTNSNSLKAGEGFSMKGTSGADLLNPSGELEPNHDYPSMAPPPSFVDKQRYDFRGKPNDGNIQIAVAPPVGIVVKSTLTGNPYPSAINLNYFLLENSGRPINYFTGVVGAPIDGNKVIDGVAYFWDQDKNVNSHNIASYQGGYGTYSPNGANANMTGTYVPATFNTYNLDGSINVGNVGTGFSYERMFSPVGQGFMVNGDVDALPGNPAVMKNIYRTFVKEGFTNKSEFAKNGTSNNTLTNSTNWDDIPNVAGVDYTQFSKLPVPQIKVRTTMNNLYTKEIAMAFNPNTTDGYDVAMDAKSQDSFPTDFNFAVGTDGKDYVITTLPFAMEKRIPVNIKSTGLSTYKVKVDSFINFDATNTVYLYDNVTEQYHDIANSAYEFSLPEGIYTDRFEITFQNAVLSNPTNIKNNFIVVQNNPNQLLSISNPNSLDMKSVVLYDISGKQIFNKVNLGSKSVYEFSTQSLSEGVYLVKLTTTDNQTLTQKILVNK